MRPPHLARIEHLGQSDFVKADCAAWHHVALLAPEFLLRLGLSSQTRVRLTKIAQIWRRFFDQIIRKYEGSRAWTEKS